MFKKNDAQSIRKIEKETEHRAEEAGKLFFYYGLVIAIIMGIFIALNVVNLDESELFNFLGLDENPFWATIFGIFIGALPAIPYMLFGRFLTAMSAHLACQSEMAAQASLTILEKMEKKEQLCIKENPTVTHTCPSLAPSDASCELPQTQWYCSRCKTLNEPYSNVCQKCGQLFFAKIETLSGNTPPVNLPNIE